jgi:PKD repeat protein
MPFTYIRRAGIALALFAVAGCTVKSTEAPPLAGPSALAISLNVKASPDNINQDGASQSAVKVTAIGPDGRRFASLPLRLDMFVGGVAQDYGTLSARSVVTNSDGEATAVYTAPPSPVNGLFGTCSGLPGNCVSIVATATSNDFANANPEQVVIRLVPTGVILPPAGQPTAQFTITPTPVNFNIPSTFDASLSTPGSGASAITSYAWTFGDGSSGTGRVVSHTYTQSTSPGNAYSVTLTITNDRGLTATTTQSVSVDASPAPSGDWVFSPATPNVGDTVFFNADAVKPAAGHKLVQLTWNFGDGSSADGFQVSHVYLTAATYQVVLSAIDDAGQKLTIAHPVGIGSGAPVVSCIASPSAAAPGVVVTLNASGSQLFGGQSVRSFAWDFADPLSGANNTSSTGPITTHQFVGPGSHSVTLTIIDTLGRQGSGFCTVTVQ